MQVFKHENHAWRVKGIYTSNNPSYPYDFPKPSFLGCPDSPSFAAETTKSTNCRDADNTIVGTPMGWVPVLT